MDRGRDRRYNDDDRPLGGETYRPSERNPPRSDYRGYRSPPRRGRTPPTYATDTYAPTDRRRSRSPEYRGRDPASYRGRPRSPPRGYSPRREVRERSPLPRSRRYSRSPVPRTGSPLPVRKDSSPYRRPRSPPPVKRERVASPPRERYDRHGYSPLRNERPPHPHENNYRPRKRSPSPRRSQQVSRLASPASSRRSSPHLRSDRLAKIDSGHRSPAYHASRAAPVEPRGRSYNDRSPPRRAYSPAFRSPPREIVSNRNRSPPPRERRDPVNGNHPSRFADTRTSQQADYRNGSIRAPPSGPTYKGSYPRDSPIEEPPAAPISMSAHNRPTSTSLLSAPTRPRGESAFPERGPRDHSHDAPPPHRGVRPPPASPYSGPSPRYQRESRPPPSDYRSSHQGPSASYEPPYRPPPPFRSNNSSSTTYPRTQRFNHLASVPSIKDGGEALPSLIDPAAQKRLAELEEGKKKLMEQIEEKQREKRKNLREWETRERESRRDGLRSELAEEALEAMSGEGTTVGTAF